jgi:tetratricopeptide (TPR) repeat protein
VAEGILGGILGEEEEKAEQEGHAAPAGAEAFAAAIVAIASRQDPQVALDTSLFLREQSALLRIQKHNLDEEHGMRLAHLRNQLSEENVRRLGLRLRVGFQLFIALVAAIVIVGMAVVLHDAFTSRSVVVEPFDTPPALLSGGLNGKVVAAGLLDELARLQDATRSSAIKRRLSNAWTGDIKLEVPETGVSVGEIAHVLKERFGHDLHITGELVQTESSGLNLTVRGDGILPKSFSGDAGNLNKLTVQAAEYVYSQSEPALFVNYLVNEARNAEAIDFSRSAYAGAEKSDRPYILNYWANALSSSGGSLTEALALYREALRQKPDFWIGYNNVINTLWDLHDEEGAWREGEALRVAAGGRPGRSPEEEYQNWDTLTWNLQAWRDALAVDADLHGGVGTANISLGPAIAEVDMRLHDLAAATLALSTTPAVENDPSIEAMTHFVRGELAQASADVKLAAAEMNTFRKEYADPAVGFNYPGYGCWAAPVLEAAGRSAEADAVLAENGVFVDCYRFRADILDGRGDWAAAQKIYTAAITLAPDLPAAYYSFGTALARHGDLDSAVVKFKQANVRGPHWADPLKAWGDVLAKQKRWSEARQKYDEALKFAPSWSELQRDRLAATSQS